MFKIVTIVGARPQFVKAAAVSRVLAANEEITELIVDTGQHYDDLMNKIFFTELQIPSPNYSLNVGSGSHGMQTGMMLIKIEEVLTSEAPDMVIVYGDTNSTTAGALAAAKLHIPVSHIEAGLRSYNRRMPEEINRITTDHISDLLFAPTDEARHNLISEGIDKSKIIVSGDVMYDAALLYGDMDTGITSELGLRSKEYALATIHRADNTDNRLSLSNIVDILNSVSLNMELVFPLHPRTKKMLQDFGLFDRLSNSIRLIDPVGYRDMLNLERNSKVIITDSGGVQKEAYFHKVPCFTLRSETEWVELIKSGWNTLIDINKPLEAAFKILNHKTGLQSVELYGAGKASSIIALEMLKYLRSGLA